MSATQLPMWVSKAHTAGKGQVDSLERYYTPPELARFCLGLLPWEGVDRVLEPHAGGYAFAGALEAMGLDVVANDLDRESKAVRHHGAESFDFLTGKPSCGHWGRGFDRVIGNPPFSNAEEHVEMALNVSDEVAFLLPLDRLESAGRLGFWRRWPPRRVWVLSERVWSGSRCIAWFWWDCNDHAPTRMDVVSWRGGS